jgi:integrase
LLDKGIDPSAERKAKKEREFQLYESTLAYVAHEWHVKHHQGKSPEYAKRIWRGLEKDIFPTLGATPIDMITGPQLRQAIMKIDERGAHETARRMLQVCGRIISYAHAMGYTQNDPTRGIQYALTPAKTRHFPSILEPEKIGALLRAMEGYDHPITRHALMLGIYTFVRPGELRQAEWPEFDYDKGVWRIPEHKMKMRRPHLVPLSTQVIELLKDLWDYTSNGPYLFPSVRSRKKCMSDATINAALRRMGYTKDDITGHGFRHMASTLLNEQGTWTPDAIERQLAHVDRSKVRATYDHSEHLSERKRLMQAWADYLDELKQPGEVISFFEHQAH